ncbi:MAG: hypothetical protein V4692_09650 [Bdellovibrionota bacterium]
MKSILFIPVASLIVLLVAATNTYAQTPAPEAATTAPQSAAKRIKFAFKDAEIVTVIETYAKASGQKFVLDASVRGKTTILTESEVTLDEAFALLSDALSLNGFAIAERDRVMNVAAARNIQRDLIPTLTELPPLRPQRMATLVVRVKHTTADEINKRLRILPSRDGEMTAYAPNQLIITDWTSNLHRIAAIIKEVDQPKAKSKN